MYESYFGLQEKPFAITPDPRYLYQSARHREALAHLVYGLQESGGFVQLTGEVGTGKTMITRTLLGQLPENVDVALVLNPRVTVHELLSGICKELDIPLPERSHSVKAIVDHISDYLMQTYAKGRRTVLIIDEAQNLSHQVLEQIRLLTNLETTKQKLLQIILIGQPELNEILGARALRQVSERITARYHLAPLSYRETCQYIEHRLRVAGMSRPLFTKGAMLEIFRRSSGVPRRINVLCDRALLGAFAKNKGQVDWLTVWKAVREVDGDAKSSGKPLNKWLISSLALICMAFVGYAMWPNEPVQKRRFVDSTLDLPTQTASESLTRSPAPVVPVKSRVDTLDDRLSNAELGADLKTSFEHLFSLWGKRGVPVSGENGCSVANRVGLSCYFESSNLAGLKRLNVPAMVELVDSRGGRSRPIAVSVEGQHVHLWFDGEIVKTPVQEFVQMWNGDLVVFYPMPDFSERSVLPGESGAKVRWLARRVSQIDGLPLPENTEYFSDDLRERVVRFQQQRKVAADGLVNEQTLVLLSLAVKFAGQPSLTK